MFIATKLQKTLVFKKIIVWTNCMLKKNICLGAYISNGIVE